MNSMLCILSYCFSRKLIYEYMEKSHTLNCTNNIDILVVVCIPTLEINIVSFNQTFSCLVGISRDSRAPV